MKIDGDWRRAPATQRVFDALERADITAFFVGGCVRNAILGVDVSDIDLASAAPPGDVIAAVEATGLKAVPTGIEHGTVTVVSDGVPHEITTFRRDVTTDGRHAEVAFSDRIEDDAARRDFTMNALYADRHGAVQDPVGGLPDLRDRRVRFIGDAGARITEDYLRILRFFRFHAYYGDPAEGLDPEGLAACAAHADGLSQLSAERVGAEMSKLLLAPDPAPSVFAMAQAGILARVMPGAEVTGLPVLVHLEAARPPRLARRIAALGGKDLKTLWRLSNTVADEVARLRDLIGATNGLSEIAYRHGRETAEDTALLRAALFEQPLSGLDEIEIGAQAVFPVKAADLMPALSGPELGAKLKELEARWIASGFTLTRDALL
ncbi:poly(A) polymerase [Litoreibacter ponti]|uniref:Poly(A) polymerase n=1 Tax=Litoreibacter ponti TaxID=1510457 RepID=A0A2T6BPP8_9RHOB|nr:CCA tRNA nucleotidyltransferase [Litoreibacter ponti]PTX58049.1 poly(A) polymerase [Litoreibacter ponti]